MGSWHCSIMNQPKLDMTWDISAPLNLDHGGPDRGVGGGDSIWSLLMLLLKVQFLGHLGDSVG